MFLLRNAARHWSRLSSPKGIFGDIRITHDFRKISGTAENLPILREAGPISEPESRIGAPDFRGRFTHRIDGLFCPRHLANSYSRLVTGNFHLGDR